jgi:hypothetical protein
MELDLNPEVQAKLTRMAREHGRDAEVLARELSSVSWITMSGLSAK